MAQRTIEIDGVGKVQVDDSFFQLPADQQNAQVQEIAASMGHPKASAAAGHPSGTIELDPSNVWMALVNHETHNTPGAVGPETPYGRAIGLAQTLTGTAQEMAKKLGMPWRPDLMRGTSKEARVYQANVGKEYFNQGLAKYNGDVRKALMYYHGGPDEKLWGPKTHAYADAILGAAQGNPTPDTPLIPPSEASAPADVSVDGGGTTPLDLPPTAPAEFTDEQKGQIIDFLKGKPNADQIRQYASGLTGHTLTIGDPDKIAKYLKSGGDPEKLSFVPSDMTVPKPPEPSLLEKLGHKAAVVARGAGQGLTDIAEGAGQGVADLMGGIGVGQTLSPIISKLGNDAYSSIVGDFGKAKSALDRYLTAGAEGVAGTLAGGAGLEDSTINLIKAGVGGGIGSQAASDLGLPPVLGAVLGGGIAHPEARSAVTENIPGARARMVKKIVKNPLGPELSEVTRDYKTMAEQVNPKGAAPKGRQPLSVEEINAVGDRGLKGLRNMISKSPIPQTQKLLLSRALDQAVEIPLERTPDMGPDRIALSDLPDTVEGRAVKAAIRRAKAGDMLSARYGGQKLGPMGKAFNLGIDALPLPYGKGILRLKGGDINKSRMDAAAKAIKRSKIYAKAGRKLGPSGFGPAMADMYAKAEATAAASDAAKAAKARAIAQRQAEAQAVKQSNDLMSRRMERNIIRPTEGYRGMIYQQTGVTQPVQDQALLHLVKRGELDPKDLKRVMADPNSLMRGKSKAGLKIMDRINQLADEGIIPRDPDWKGPPEPVVPQGIMPWLDAEGLPIRSMGAYAGGIAKNIVREMSGENPFIDRVGVEEPPKPAKTKTKKKNKKQGA